MSKKTGRLYCGACGDGFNNGADLLTHHKTCRAYDLLLPLALRVYLGRDVVGHRISWLITSVRKSVPLIRKYAWAVANDINTLQRAELHGQLCDTLDIPHRVFRPFEDSKIRDIPDQDQAEAIIYEWLRRHAADITSEYPS